MIKVCNIEEVKVGIPYPIKINEDKLLVFRILNKDNEEQWYITDEICTHAKISLAGGFINNTDMVVECPAHGAQFSLDSGEVLCAPATKAINTYKAIIEDDILYYEKIEEINDLENEVEEPSRPKMDKFSLVVKDLKVKLADSDKVLLNDLSLEINPGELLILQGENGSGKSTFCNAIMGNSNYEIESGNIFAKYDDEKIVDITKLETYEKAQMGIFLSPQAPTSIPGVSLEAILKGYDLNLDESEVKNVGLDEIDLNRGIHDGFSGGEKKRAEALLAKQITPSITIFDEIDSGLDVEALDVIALTIKYLVSKGSGVVVITHLQELLDRLNPTKVIALNS